MKREHASERYKVSAHKQSLWFNSMTDDERAEWERKLRAGMQRWREGRAIAKLKSERSK